MKTFKHSGNLGDIVYSLPTIIALGGGKLYVGDGTGDLGLDDKCKWGHPPPMTKDMVMQIIELLRLQSYLCEVVLYNNEKVDCNLDKFREYPCFTDHLANWHLRAFGVKFNLNLPWLENIEARYVNDIVINHSGRWFNRFNRLNWEALVGYESRCVFIGFEEEYSRFRTYTGLNIQRYPVTSILEFAQIIKGSKLYIGNQSLGFALAEAMKHPRVIEVCYFFSNCMPQSGNGYIRLRESLVKRHVTGRATRRGSGKVDAIRARIRNWWFHHVTEQRMRCIVAVKGSIKKRLPALVALRKFLR